MKNMDLISDFAVVNKAGVNGDDDGGDVSEILDVNNQLEGTVENMDLISDFAVVNKAEHSSSSRGFSD